jgi:hypothetical protein
LDGKLEPSPSELLGEGSKAYHAGRIAHLVINGWNDPIDIDVGVPVLSFTPTWLVPDGNHRLAAAIFRDDEFIAADVSGDIDLAFELFGIDVSEDEFEQVSVSSR